MIANIVRYVISNPEHTNFASSMHSCTGYLSSASLFNSERGASIGLSDWLDQLDINVIVPVKVTLELDCKEEEEE